MPAWNNWYHVSSNTYGTWLPGDRRGWRERKHKKHVDGDYKNPPKESHDGLHDYASELLKQPPVHLNLEQREPIGRALVDMLVHEDVELLVLAVGMVHLHVLGRFLEKEVRPKVGRAKKHAYFIARDHGFEGTLWGDGTDVVPIEDRRHQLNVFEYLRRHVEEGAWVWTFREGRDWPCTIQLKGSG